MLTFHFVVVFISLLVVSHGFKMQTSRSRFALITMAVPEKSSYKVTLLTGDGIGPEIMAATLPVLEAVGKKGKKEDT